MRYTHLLLIIALFLLTLSFVFARPPFSLRSSAFDPGDAIPLQYTHNLAGCPGGDNLNPPLEITPPLGTGSFILIMDDPDVVSDTEEGGDTDPFVHWVVWNIPADTTEIPEGWVPPMGVAQGMNGFSLSEGMAQTGYGGPCPPVGESHHYVFHLFAIEESSVDLVTLADTSGDGIITVGEVNAAADADQFTIVATTTLTGLYPDLSVCGNGVVEETEQCDGTDVGGNSCTSMTEEFFIGGTLGCTEQCTFDMSACMIDIPPASVLQGGLCTQDLQCVEGLSCVVGECRNIGFFLDGIHTILDSEEFTKRQMIVYIAIELRNFLG